MQEVEYQFKKHNKEIGELSQTIQGNLEQISQLQNVIQTIQGPTKHFGQSNIYVHTPGARTLDPSPAKSAILENQVEDMRNEKEHLNQKLDEFSNILRDFQNNQKQYEHENQSLKAKINSMEGSTNQPMSGFQMTGGHSGSKTNFMQTQLSNPNSHGPHTMYTGPNSNISPMKNRN